MNKTSTKKVVCETKRKIVELGDSTSQALFEIALHFQASSSRAMLFCLEREYGVTCVLGRKREYENRTRATHIWVNVPYPVQVQKVEGLMKKYDTTFAGLCKLAIHETRAKLHTIEEDELTHKYFK